MATSTAMPWSPWPTIGFGREPLKGGRGSLWGPPMFPSQARRRCSAWRWESRCGCGNAGPLVNHPIRYSTILTSRAKRLLMIHFSRYAALTVTALALFATTSFGQTPIDWEPGPGTPENYNIGENWVGNFVPQYSFTPPETARIANGGTAWL